MRKIPFDKAKLEEIATKWPTPFHVYDAKAIRENARRLKKAFAWNKGFREYFAVKAAPNPHLMKLLKEFDFGSDCSSMAELVLAEKVGNVGDKIMFTSNDTPAEEFRKAWELGAIINLDDITHWDFLTKVISKSEEGKSAEWSDRIMCCRYNPGPLKGGNAIIGKPEEAKYGFTREQLFECYRKMKEAGVTRFGLHTMVASNELDPDYIVDTAKLLLELVADLSQQLGISFEFINIGGGIGIPYKPDQKPMDLEYVGKGIEAAYKANVVGRDSSRSSSSWSADAASPVRTATSSRASATSRTRTACMRDSTPACRTSCVRRSTARTTRSWCPARRAAATRRHTT